MTNSQMLFRACVESEAYSEELLAAWENVTDETAKKFKQELRDYLHKLRAYRKHRWGRTELESICEDAKEITVANVTEP